MYNKEFEKIFKLAENKVDEIEIYLSKNNSFSVAIDKQEIEEFKYADSIGLGIRILKDGKIGYAYTEDLSDEAFEMIINEAIEGCKILEDISTLELNNYPSIQTKLDIYNPELNDIDVNDKIAKAKKLEKLAVEADSRVVNVPRTLFGDGKNYVKIANSKGLNKESISNIAYAYVSVLVGNESEKRSGFEFSLNRNFDEIIPEKIAEIAVNKGLELLDAKNVVPGVYPIIFNNEMMAAMLSTFATIFSSKSVQEGRSLLKGKIGDSIGGENINIYDDALHKDGNATRPFDSEGYPSQKTVLVEKGILKNFLYNTETAAKDNVKSTGNGSRSYKGNLSVNPSNLYIDQGKFSKKELYQKFPKVIEIVSLQGLHSGANTISGDFSLSGEGFLYENGIRQHSLKDFTVSGNFVEMLKDVIMIADDFKFNLSSVGSASTLVKELSISG